MWMDHILRNLQDLASDATGLSYNKPVTLF